MAISISDFVRIYDNQQLAGGSRWGDWILRADNLTLEFTGAEGWYEIDLEDITDSARMLDWIFQVQQKPWMTGAIMGNLLSALKDIFHPQANLCAGGRRKKLNAAAFLKRRLLVERYKRSLAKKNARSTRAFRQRLLWSPNRTWAEDILKKLDALDHESASAES